MKVLENGQPGRLPTLRDVAERAGVSLATASQALNNRPSVMPETRRRVLESAEALGYRPLRSRRYEPLAVVGMLVKHDHGLPLTFNPFFSQVQIGVEQECRARHLSLMVATVDVDRSNRPVMWPRMIEDNSVDGLLLVGTNIQMTAEALQHKYFSDKPIVLVDGYARGFHFDSVLIDNFGGATQAIEHLVELGHRHIGLIGSNPDSPPDILERRQAYFATLQRHGITATYVEDSLMNREAGYEMLQRLLRRAPQVTAVFVVNDDTAIGVLQAAQDMGLRIPEDLSVVGFDDIALASQVRPALTTVGVPIPWLGRLGVRHLLERSRNPDQPQVISTLATQLVVRQSSGPCRR